MNQITLKQPKKVAELTGLAPGSFGCHEALHVASVLAEMVDERLCQHPSVTMYPMWKHLADKARDDLFELYQEIGRLHL